MKALTEYQQKLVEENLDVVDQVLKYRITARGSVLLAYEDFYQIGCEALCRAAAAYQPSIGEFKPYASKAVYNAAIDHIRKQKLESSLRACSRIPDSDDDSEEIEIAGDADTEQEVIDSHMIELIASYR